MNTQQIKSKTKEIKLFSLLSKKFSRKLKSKKNRKSEQIDRASQLLINNFDK